MTLNCIIIDDEPLATGLLSSYAKKTPFINLIGAYNSAIEAMPDIRNHHIHLIFLDIQMPELSGMEFAKVIDKNTKVIFTTAFQQYAIDAVKVGAADYLLKPIAYNDFLDAATRVLNSYESNNTVSEDRFMFVKSDYKLIKISFDEIQYVEGLKDYLKIFLENGTCITSLMNMKTLFDYLPKPEFLRTHRSFIVNMTKVDVIDRMRIVFGKVYIPISDSYKGDILAYLDSHMI